GKELSFQQKNDLYAIFRQSSHPLSKIILSSLSAGKPVDIQKFEELLGKGMETIINNNTYKVGSASFLQVKNNNLLTATRVHVNINVEYSGYFQIENTYRKNLKTTLSELKKHFKLSLISGDNDSERENLLNYFNRDDSFLFNQTPNDKLNYIKSLQKNNETTL